METKNTFFEECAISFLPTHLKEAVRRGSSLFRGAISEIRLRRGCVLTMTSADKNILTPIRCTEADINYTVRALCGNSLYSHSETIKDGYICTEGGIRAGVCGRAVTEGGRIISVTDISSVCIRIPHRIPGASDEICKYIMRESFRGMIIYSSPGKGKTTALREIVARMASKPYSMRVAVIDTRFEICGGLGGELTVDSLSGYPRAKGIESALRTLSPQLIICDEIGNIDDSNAILESFGSGVPCVVSAHAGSYDELKERHYIKDLLQKGVFTYAVGLLQKGKSFICEITEVQG